MRFYYISIVSVMLLAIIYAAGTAILALFGAWLKKRWAKAWTVMVPLFLLLYAAPVAEEFWIAWNFGQLCKKDAGIFVYKTVEVEGFYDTTAELRNFSNPALPQSADYYNNGGFHFYELTLLDARGGPKRVVHYEKANGAWTPTVLDHPTARYHYTRNIYGERVQHKISRQESRVTDSSTGEVVGRYVEYGRSPPWFFVSLGAAPYSCDGPDGGPNSKFNSLVYRDVLKPIK